MSADDELAALRAELAKARTTLSQTKAVQGAKAMKYAIQAITARVKTLAGGMPEFFIDFELLSEEPTVFLFNDVDGLKKILAEDGFKVERHMIHRSCGEDYCGSECRHGILITWTW